MKTIVLIIALAIAAHQAVGALLLESTSVKTIQKHNSQIELAINGELR